MLPNLQETADLVTFTEEILKTNIKSMQLQLQTKHSNQGEYKTLLSRLV